MTTTINGTTGVDKVVDGSITQADLAANVTGNGPCFSAGIATDPSLSILPGVATKLVFPIVQAGSVGYANNSFTAPIAGWYGFFASACFHADFTADIKYLNLKVEGASDNVVCTLRGDTKDGKMSGSTLIFLTAGQLVSVYLYQNSAGTVYEGWLYNQVRFSGFLARAA
jgi:hypothetical protein